MSGEGEGYEGAGEKGIAGQEGAKEIEGQAVNVVNVMHVMKEERDRRSEWQEEPLSRNRRNSLLLYQIEELRVSGREGHEHSLADLDVRIRSPIWR